MVEMKQICNFTHRLCSDFLKNKNMAVKERLGYKYKEMHCG